MNATLQRRTLLVLQLFLSPFGRIRSGPCWLGLLALSVAALAVSAGFGMLTPPPGGFAGKPLAVFNFIIVVWTSVVLHTPGPGLGMACSPGEGCRHFGSMIGMEVALFFCFCAFCLQAKRLHDAGHTALWILVFALFEFLSPFGLGLITKAVFKPEDISGFIFAVGGGVFLNTIPPAIFKLWVGVARHVPAANEHGVEPGPWDLTRPERRALSMLWRRKA